MVHLHNPVAIDVGARLLADLSVGDRGKGANNEGQPHPALALGWFFRCVSGEGIAAETIREF